MAGKPKGDVALTNRERNRAYRVRKQRADRALHRRLADCVAALHAIAFDTHALTDARKLALEALVDAGG